MLHALARRQADVDGAEDPLVQLSFNKSTRSDGNSLFAVFEGYMDTEIYARVKSRMDGVR